MRSTSTPRPLWRVAGADAVVTLCPLSICMRCIRVQRSDRCSRAVGECAICHLHHLCAARSSSAQPAPAFVRDASGQHQATTGALQESKLQQLHGHGGPAAASASHAGGGDGPEEEEEGAQLAGAMACPRGRVAPALADAAELAAAASTIVGDRPLDPTNAHEQRLIMGAFVRLAQLCKVYAPSLCQVFWSSAVRKVGMPCSCC